jgi:hypothetical protein
MKVRVGDVVGLVDDVKRFAGRVVLGGGRLEVDESLYTT